jgi:hypothetical protein
MQSSLLVVLVCLLATVSAFPPFSGDKVRRATPAGCESTTGGNNSIIEKCVRLTDGVCLIPSSGNAAGAACSFPMTFMGATYNDCAYDSASSERWCYTTTTSKWGNCLTTCMQDSVRPVVPLQQSPPPTNQKSMMHHHSTSISLSSPRRPVLQAHKPKPAHARHGFRAALRRTLV